MNRVAFNAQYCHTHKYHQSYSLSILPCLSHGNTIPQVLPPYYVSSSKHVYLIFFGVQLRLAYLLLNCASGLIYLQNGLQVPKLPLQVGSPNIIQDIRCGCIFHFSLALFSFSESSPLHTLQVNQYLCPNQIVASPLVSCKNAPSNVSVVTHETHYGYATSQVIATCRLGSLCTG